MFDLTHNSQSTINKYGYRITPWMDSVPSDVKFPIHWHDEYEIYLFLNGHSQYTVNEKIYNLEPLDIIVIKKHEMHHVIHSDNASYKRCVLMISPTFFQIHNCAEYENFFLNSATLSNDKIPGDYVRSSGLYDAFQRYKKYAEFSEPAGSPVLCSIVTEILYLINNIHQFSHSYERHKTITPLLLYLNNNYTEDVNLDMLASKFYLSKHYLCRLFRSQTGLTIYEYIRTKRLSLVYELQQDGYSLSEAAEMAGFKNYSSFYRAYVTEYGFSPKNNKKQPYKDIN